MTKQVNGRQSPDFAGAGIPQPPIPDDDGEAAPELRECLAQFGVGHASGREVLAALADARVFVPVLALLEEAEDDERGDRNQKSVTTEKVSSMATVIADSAEHGRALLGFSSLRALAMWRQDARPVALQAPLAARAALSESAETLLVDIAGPSPFAVSDYDLLLLAAVARPSASSGHDPARDPVLVRAIARLLPSALQQQFALTSQSGSGGAMVTLTFPESTTTVEALVTLIADDQVVRRLLPNGLRVVVSDTPPHPGA